ncbi:MAG: EAL domain-containing protein [Pseudomonadota bacterium]|nr:EAL domain-containing protein [Pseudomonadota bacterium]
MPDGVPLPRQRPVFDLHAERVCGFDLLPPEGLAPPDPAADYPHDRFIQDVALRRRWLEAAHLAGLTAHRRWIVLPVHVGRAAQHADALSIQLRDGLAAAALGARSAGRMVIQFEGSREPGESAHTRRIARLFREHGFTICIAGFGDGCELGHDLLDAAPELLRLSPALTGEIATDRSRRSVLAGVVSMARDLGIGLIADHVDTPQQAATLLALDIHLQTGSLHGNPAPMPLR